MATNKTITKERVYSITITDFSDGSQALSRVNEGFNFNELIGILEHTKSDLMKRFEEAIKPDLIETKCIVNKQTN